MQESQVVGCGGARSETKVGIHAHAEARIASSFDRTIWGLVAAVALVVWLLAVVKGLTFNLASFSGPLIVSAVLAGVGWIYGSYRPDARLAAALSGTSQLVAFAALGAPLSYIAATFNFPLHDRLFSRIDQAMLFDWMALFSWMKAHPTLHKIFNAAYLSFTVQASVTVLVLAFSHRLIHLRKFLLAFFATALVTIAISAVLPAQGAWAEYGLQNVQQTDILPATRDIHLPVFHGLRDGTFVTLVATGSEGIITFPSLHAALAVIFIFALWPVPVLRWFGLAVNLLMIAATPIDGGHYLVDVLVGLALALVCWKAVDLYLHRPVEHLAYNRTGRNA